MINYINLFDGFTRLGVCDVLVRRKMKLEVGIYLCWCCSLALWVPATNLDVDAVGC